MNQKSFVNKAVVFSMLLIIFGSVYSVALPLQESEYRDYNKVLLPDEIVVETPMWTIGDSWTYSIEIDGMQGDSLDFHISIDNFKMQVEDINDDMYHVSLSVPRGDFNGNGNVDLDIFQISGSLTSTRLDGLLLINRSNLKIIDGEFTIDGYVDKAIDIPFTIEANLSFYGYDQNLTIFSPFEFPFTIEDSWPVPFTYIIMTMDVNLMPETAFVFTYIDEHQFTCNGWDVVVTNEMEYDALLISSDFGSKMDVWYSLSVGNLVKIDYDQIPLGFDYYIDHFEMILESTTYEVSSNPPDKPSTPIGQTQFNAGESGNFESSATDPDNDNVKYIFDWGDGTISSTDFYTSGETGIISKEWNQKGTFDVRVKARDIYGKESSWSDSLTVTVLNEKPEKPLKPEGPAEGRIENSYSYKTSSTDPDDHQLMYGWDWDGDNVVDEWTDYFDSGVEITSTHTWYAEGLFEIKVKCQDLYGEESDWSEPLQVTMPKCKLHQILDMLSCIINHNEFILRIIEIINYYD